jgi:circadian clock protein KaiC
MSNGVEAIVKVATGIGGFDQMALGGLPRARLTLVAGTSGSGKTLFAVEFLAHGVRALDEPGVFVTFAESPAAIRQNVASLGYDLGAWEAAGKWRFVDASFDPPEEHVEVGAFDFGALLSRIEHAVNEIGATRVAVDSIEATFSRFADSATVRMALLRAASALKTMDVTSVITAERFEEYGAISRFGVEEYIADNVVILRNVLEREKRRRTIEILKLRGGMHRTGEFSFAIDPVHGITVIPFALTEVRPRASIDRISTGQVDLDRICGGGFYRDSITFLSGPTGTGKTLLSTCFVAAGVAAGEPSLLISFEESREQLFRDAAGWGIDLEAMEGSGKLGIVSDYPEMASLEFHFLTVREAIERFRPRRVAIDNLSALERVATERGLRDFIIGLAAYLRQEEIASLFTSPTATLFGASTTATEAHVSTLADNIILLLYLEAFGEMRRGITVLKARSSAHDHRIYEYTIDGQGMRFGQPFRDLSGIFSGQAVRVVHAIPEDVTLVLEDEEAR